MSIPRICLVGVKGIGKTYLVNHVLPNIPQIDHIYGSSLMRELVGPCFSQFDMFPEVEKKAIRRDVIIFLKKRQKERSLPLLIQGHMTLFDPTLGKAVEIFTDEDCAFYTDLILLEIPPEMIVSNREREKYRHFSCNIHSVKSEIMFEHRTAKKIAEQYSMNLTLLKGEKAEKMVDECTQILKKICYRVD